MRVNQHKVIAGVIVEYNPFHNGHYYHLQQTKEETNADVVVAVMSGNFLQRGEPSIISKWERAEIACKLGADLVIELPYAYATQSAQIFAKGAIKLLDALHCTDFCFGSEAGTVTQLQQLVSLKRKNRVLFDEKVSKYVSEGISYAQAQTMVFKQLSEETYLSITNNPNNLLGLHYIEENFHIEKSMNVHTITRKQANYNDATLPTHGDIASATSIRKNLKQQSDIFRAGYYMPEISKSLLCSYKNKYGLWHDWEQYWPYLQYQLLTQKPTSLQKIAEVSEGIEYRLIATAKSSHTFEQFMQALKTKRYSWTRLQRMCLHILTNTTKEEIAYFQDEGMHIRLLGMTEVGRKHLQQIKHDLPFPFISKLSSANQKLIDFNMRLSYSYAQPLSGENRLLLANKEYQSVPFYNKQQKNV